MALVPGDREYPFKISNDVAREISEEFGFTLTKKEISTLETASRQTIRWRRSVKNRNGFASNLDYEYRTYTASVRHQKRIARLTNNLLNELQADEAEAGSWSLRSKNDRSRGFHPNALRKAIGRFDDIAPMLQSLHRFALEPGPEPPWVKAAKRGRPQNVDAQGWDALLHAASSIFHGRGKSPTANYVSRQRRYTSRFLRGVLILHDALPAEIRAEPDLPQGFRADHNLRDCPP